MAAATRNVRTRTILPVIPRVGTVLRGPETSVIVGLYEHPDAVTAHGVPCGKFVFAAPTHKLKPTGCPLLMLGSELVLVMVKQFEPVNAKSACVLVGVLFVMKLILPTNHAAKSAEFAGIGAPGSFLFRGSCGYGAAGLLSPPRSIHHA